ncbi:hypothetical protein CRG98_019632, partial [Punica granatum]
MGRSMEPRRPHDHRMSWNCGSPPSQPFGEHTHIPRPGVLPAYSAALPTHLPPPASSGAPLPPASPTFASTNDQARIAALEGTVNQMATNMVELLALLRGPNRASSSSTPPPGLGPTVDPTPWAPPTQAPENVEAPAPPTLYTSTVHPFTSQIPPPPTPSVVPLPPATFLSAEHVLSAPPPVSIPAPAMAYTVPPPTVFSASTAPAPTHLQATELPPYPSLQPHAGLSYQVPPPINSAFHEPGMPTHAAQKIETPKVDGMGRVNETRTRTGSPFPSIDRGVFGSLAPRPRCTRKRVGEAALRVARLDWKLRAVDTRKAAAAAGQGKTGRHAYSRHGTCALNALRCSGIIVRCSEIVVVSAFRGNTLKARREAFVTTETYFGRPNRVPEGCLKLVPRPWWSLGACRPVLRGHLLCPEFWSEVLPWEAGGPKWGADNTVNAAQQAPQQYSMNYTAAPPVAPSYAPHAPQYRPQPPTQPIYYSALPPPPLPTVSSTIMPLLHPKPLNTNLRLLKLLSRHNGPRPRKSKRCEYHQGAPEHTIDNCWKLREKIQEMIDAKELVFNAVRFPNVQANLLPDHWPAQGPSINMITVCTSSEGEGEQGWPSPFVIEYVPAEAAVGFAGIDAPHAPLVIDVPAWEPYSNDRVPWTYEGGVGNLEQQFGVMGITRLGRLYENPATTDKGKAPATE